MEFHFDFQYRDLGDISTIGNIMKRRHFIKSSLVIASSVSSIGSYLKIRPVNNSENRISGFIFSDAHIGWKGYDQPTMVEQKEAIQVILSQFPNLDLVFDTGDIHHGYLNERERNDARKEWLSGFSNPFSKSLFHYIPGNHELGKGPSDTEITASKLGSHNLRPYYSFDYKGIHFVSLPQLMDIVLINRESLDWLRHDLSVNSHKTTLILSHNSILDTTYTGGQTGYRSVVNSQDVLNVMNKHNNVIAWLHGHNHQYQIVKKHGRLYVSNGRIGGFNPPQNWGSFGQGHLGGVYFEISERGIIIKCYSATKRKFFDQIGFAHLSQYMNIKTTFNKSHGVNYFFGHGSLTNNVKHKIVNHYLTKNEVEFDIKELKDPTLNDNSNFEITTELFFKGKHIKRIIGYQLLPVGLQRKSVAKGLLIENNLNKTVTLNLPSQKKTDINYMVRGSYFRCESNDEFKVEMKLSPFKSEDKMKARIKIYYIVYNINQFEIFASKKFYMEEKDFIYSTKLIKVPELRDYNEKYLRVSFEFIGFPKKFILSKLALSKRVDKNILPSLSINGKRHADLRGGITLDQNEFQNDGTTSIKYKGTQPISCLIKISNVEWQIRNAESTFKDNCINLIEYRHYYQPLNVVILKPIHKKTFYLNKVIDLMPVKIIYFTKSIKIKIIKINPKSCLVMVVSGKPIKLYGSSKYLMKGNTLTIFPESKNIEVFFK